jgi:curved DNA-binding protein CbpA
MDLYKLMRVGRNATLSEIKASYRKLALEYHPDLNGGDKKKTELFRNITAAYEKLSNYAQTMEREQAQGRPGPSSSSGGARPSPFPSSSRGFGRRRGQGPPPPGTYNVDAWREAHFGSAKHYDTQFAATVDAVRAQKIKTATAFMRGMDQNKTFQHSQRMDQREADRMRDRNGNGNEGFDGRS